MLQRPAGKNGRVVLDIERSHLCLSQNRIWTSKVIGFLSVPLRTNPGYRASHPCFFTAHAWIFGKGRKEPPPVVNWGNNPRHGLSEKNRGLVFLCFSSGATFYPEDWIFGPTQPLFSLKGSPLLPGPPKRSYLRALGCP